jgi:hypothetical protein
VPTARVSADAISRRAIDPLFNAATTRNLGSPWRESCRGARTFDDPDFRSWEAACVPDSWDQPGYPVIDGLHRDPGATQADPGR